MCGSRKTTFLPPVYIRNDKVLSLNGEAALANGLCTSIRYDQITNS